MSSDWRGGFLFVGNQLALDFLNTRPVMDGDPVELLLDNAALAQWLGAAGLISHAHAARLSSRWSPPQSHKALEQLRRLREDLRAAVLQMEAGAVPPARFVQEINRLLVRYPYREQVVAAASRLERRKVFHPDGADEAFAPLADAIADLLTNLDRSRLRKCRRCVLHFYDTSKKGTRAWCSMNLCGNRSKVAAYAQRKRAAAK